MSSKIDLEKLRKAKPEKPKKKKGKGGCLIFLTGSLFFVILLAGLGAIYLSYTAYFQVNTHEQVVITRFGSYSRTLGPGLHFKLPFGIEKAIHVDTRTSIEEFGFRTVKAGIKSKLDKNFQEESLILTGDLNMADVKWVVQYKVVDAAKFLFNVKNVKRMIRDISLSAMQNVVGDQSVSNVITVGRIEISRNVKEIMQKAFDEFQMGVKVDVVNIKEANPPESVKASFNEVNEAKQEMEKVINQAWGQYNTAIPKVKGVVEQRIQEAEGYQFEKVKKATGEAGYFLSLLKEYKLAPEVTRQRMYFETIEKVIPQVENLYVTDPARNELLPVLPLSSTPFSRQPKPPVKEVSK